MEHFELLKKDPKKHRSQLIAGSSDMRHQPGQAACPPNVYLPGDILVGRDEALKTLRKIREEVLHEKAAAILISGDPGTGKTSLVERWQAEYPESAGYFVSAFFQPAQQNSPYAAIASFSEQLVQQVLTEDDETLLTWRDEIIRKLDSNVHLLIELIPALELLIGRRGISEKIQPEETRIILQQGFRDFISTLTEITHKPLVFFLDDLHWADPASLDLLVSVFNGNTLRQLLFIVAWSEIEHDTERLLQTAIDTIKQSGAAIAEINLEGLSADDIQQLVTETLGENSVNTRKLAGLIHQKTQGNPFSTRELLNNLYARQLIRFEKSWLFDGKMIAEENAGDHMTFITDRKKDLPDSTLAVLNTACCLGESFAESLIAELLNEDKAKVILNLELLLEREILCKRGPNYMFVNGRIAKVLWLSIPEKERMETHYRIGRHLLLQATETGTQKNCYFIAHHFNQTFLLARDPKEQQLIAEINLKAGCKAKNEGAFATALHFVRSGLEALPATPWDDNYALTLALYTEMAEVTQLNSHDEAMHEAVSAVQANAVHPLDLIRVTEILMAHHCERNEFKKAINIGTRALKTVGVQMSQNPTRLSIVPSLLKTILLTRGKSTVAILNLPEATNEEKTAAMRILKALFLPAFYTHQEFFLQLILKAVQLTVKNGITPFSETAFLIYGSVLDFVFLTFGNVTKYRQLGINLARRLKRSSAEAYVQFILACHINHWSFHLGESLDILKSVYLQAKQTGDIQTSALAIANYTGFGLWTRTNLTALDREYDEYTRCFQTLKNKSALHHFTLYRQWIASFRTPGNTPGILSGPYFNENTAIPELIRQHNFAALCTVYVVKTNLLFHFRQYRDAFKYAKKAQRIIQAIYGKYAVAIHNLFYSLTAAELAKTATLRDRKRYCSIIRKNQKVMRTWAHSCPQNYLHMYYLVKAEFLSVTGDHTQASVYYQQAILSARENGFTQIEALANERVGVYFLRMNNEFVAQSYLNEAHSLYTGWEAFAKTDFLRQEHPDFFSPDPGPFRTTIESTPPPEAAESRNPALRAKDGINPFVEIPGREEPEHAETLKDEFLTTASYELQNPLEGIIGITRTLIDGAKGEIPEPVQSDLSLVVSEARGLSKLVDDILDFSRLKNERIQLRTIPIDLHQVVEVVLFFARSWSRDNGMTYTNSIDADMPLVSADKNRLQQILLNLMAHALRSSPPGILDISARKINEMVAVTVALTPAETSNPGQEQIQAPVAPPTGSAAGDQNPIQLYIIKKLVTLHGGRLTVDALDNSGPSFTLTLPVSRQESQPSAAPVAVFAPEGSVAPENPLAEVNPTLPPAETSPPGQQTILIVNDEPAGLQYLVNELTLQNYRVQIARDGFEAMERLKEEPPDLVLLDLIMPRMNGFEFCRCIRKNHELSALPIVMLIDRNRTNDLALGLQCGANDYLTKPFQKEELEIRIRNQLAAQKTTATIKELKYLKKELFLKEENEARLNISQQKLRTILDQVSDPVFFFDAHLRITHLNKKAEDLFGCQRTQLGEKKVCHLLPDIEEKVLDFQNIVHWSDEEFNQWKEHPVALRIHSGNQESFDMHAFISRLESRQGEFSIILSHSSETASRILPASLGKQKVRERIVTKDAHFREQLVRLMRLSLAYWEAATGKDKFDLAEQSGLWKVQIDQGSLRARTLDKYLDIRQLSKHPRWKDVIKTAHYVLDNCPVLPVMKKELEDQTSRVLSFLNRNKIKRPL